MMHFQLAERYMICLVSGWKRGSCWKHEPIGYNFRLPSKFYQTKLHSNRNSFMHYLILSAIYRPPIYSSLQACWTEKSASNLWKYFSPLKENPASAFPHFSLCSHYVISLVDALLPSWLIVWLPALQSNHHYESGRPAEWLSRWQTGWFAGWHSIVTCFHPWLMHHQLI